MGILRIKRSTTQNSVPSGLLQGELAINIADRKLYAIDGNNALQFLNFTSDAEKVNSGPIKQVLDTKASLNDLANKASVSALAAKADTTALASKVDTTVFTSSLASKLDTATFNTTINATNTSIDSKTLSASSSYGLLKSDIPNFSISSAGFLLRDRTPYKAGNNGYLETVQDKSGKSWQIDADQPRLNVQSFYRTTDTGSMHLAFSRAINALLNTTTFGGVIHAPGGQYLIQDQINIPKGTGKKIILSGDGEASLILLGAGYSGYGFVLGSEDIAGGSSDVTIKDLQFYGADNTMSKPFYMVNANTTRFENVLFSNVFTAIQSHNSFGVVLDHTKFLGVSCYGFYSDTPAHGFHAHRVFAYNVGKIGTTPTGQLFRFDGVTDNISLIACDFEGDQTTVLQTVGGTGLLVLGCYIEYCTADPIYHTGPMYGECIENNWLSYTKNNWTRTNVIGGSFKRNALDGTKVYNGVNYYDVEHGQNRLANGLTLYGLGYCDESPFRPMSNLQNGWTQGRTLGYRKDSSGRVWLKGSLNQGSANGTVAWVIPSDFRPLADQIVAAIGTGAVPVNLTIGQNGNLVPNIGSGTVCSLDGISYQSF